MTARAFIVGRHSEIDQFSALLQGKTVYPLLNIYGPSGIGKTVVGSKMQRFANEGSIPIAFIDGNRRDLTPQRILHEVAAGLSAHRNIAEALASFRQQYQDFELIQEIMQLGGGLDTMFNDIGMLKDSQAFKQILSSLQVEMTQKVERIVSNRFAVERYLRQIERTLLSTLSEGIASVGAKTPSNLVILFDTYEQMDWYDDWICRQLYPALPANVKIVILGRNSLPQINFDWRELGHNLHSMELPELVEADAKAYLRHHGLHETAALNQICRFTGGYPLLLVLVVHLAQEAGGWESLGHFEYEADRDRIATQLLERILREERVKEVQAFLEKGVVARWFTPEVISVVLEVSVLEGRKIYSKLRRHSFVERHPNGLKFHDKIRDLLQTRLKFGSKAEYDQIVERLQNFYADKAGITDKKEVENNGETNAVAAPPPEQEKSFGELLRFYRYQTKEPKSGGRLTQKRLADLLNSEEGFFYGAVMISNWERDKNPITLANRPVLVALIRLLHQYGGISSVEEANALLFAGDHRRLNEEEAQTIF